jgi:two-component system sensor histidine kinase/response regulator
MYRPNTLKAKLLKAGMVVIAALLLLATVNIYSAIRSTRALSFVYLNQVEPASALKSIDRDLKEIRFRMAGVLLDQMPSVGSSNQLTQATIDIPRAWAKFRRQTAANKMSSDTLARVAEIDQEIPAFLSFAEKLKAAYSAENKNTLSTMLEDEWPAVQANFVKPVGFLISEQQSSVKATYETSRQAGTKLILFGIAVSFGAIFFLTFFGYRFTESIVTVTESNRTLEIEIIERKHAEHELLHANETLRIMLHASPVAIAVLDPQGLVRLWNSAAERLFGWSEQEVIGGPLPTVPQDEQDKFQQRLRRALQGEDLSTEEVKRRRKDGSILEITASTAPLKDAQGRVTGVIAVDVDITERKRAEREIQRAQAAAEAANRAKSEFLANMSHEIRTPMNGVLGMTELALDTELSPEQREYLGMVKTSADALLTVINDILDFSKIEAGKLELDPIEFNIRNSVEETARMLALRAHQKGLELVTYVEPDVPEVLIGDPIRLRQVFFNLLGNAVKFTEQGEVVLRAAVHAKADGIAALHFSVTDTGIGISQGRQKAIFEAFSQADNSTTRKYGGTGLGLTITTRLINLMAGHIWVESELGKGSAFHFTANFGVGNAPALRSLVEDSATLEGLRVLVVDDNATNRRILRETLLQWRMRPTLVDGGQEALSLLQHAQAAGTPFPLVLTDMQMPEMDGFSLAEKIKQTPELTGATIMMLTSAGQRGDGARCRELGVKAYLTKPLKQSELREAILAVLRDKVSPPPDTRDTLVTRHLLREERGSLRILLAEDNHVNQVLAARLLQQKGHSVTVANNGLEALAMLETRNFDIVLMDVQMPEMDGLEATRMIREKEGPSGSHMPIIALTAYAMKGDDDRCLASGMDAYVSKPLQVTELFAVIERFYPSRRSAEKPA